MFTGIVESTGVLQEKTPIGGDWRLRFQCSELELQKARPGDSISVAGACLTMLEPDEYGFCADVSSETLSLTTLGQLQVGQAVNLELAMGLDARLGGHMVTGHVDGKARLLSRRQDARSERFEFEVPVHLSRYIAKKGSACLDGVSLTVNEVSDHSFSVCLIPHTLEVTTLGQLSPGDEVNLEVDLIARYLERLMMSVESEQAQD
ncbi:MAG: riboflavin synthase [Xanthomonadales bacterium]|jgi:riboflavin synthase|nr:riboflavin synthase [Xanthomonadales bacterium]MDH3926267.1 riboflavin synthase [Xanthomonadales bacterium]MDH4000518.1 riboflavin synthase [Xanthomonadales bacterium]